jgi:hypothetical protein
LFYWRKIKGKFLKNKTQWKNIGSYQGQSYRNRGANLIMEKVLARLGQLVCKYSAATY